MSDNGGCEKQCVNKDGSYKCQCDKGEVVTADKKTCAGIISVLHKILIIITYQTSEKNNFRVSNPGLIFRKNV